MPIGTGGRLGPGHIVLYGDPATPPKLWSGGPVISCGDMHQAFPGTLVT